MKHYLSVILHSVNTNVMLRKVENFPLDSGSAGIVSEFFVNKIYWQMMSCQCKYSQEALSAARNGIRLYAVGISNFVSENFLSQVVFSPAVRNDNYWLVPAFESLSSRVDGIANSICTYSPILPGKLFWGKNNSVVNS